MATQTLVRASVQGIVYLIDSALGKVYTYNEKRPLYVGMLEKIPEEDKNSISKTNGCLATARVCYRPDIREAMARERHISLSDGGGPERHMSLSDGGGPERHMSLSDGGPERHISLSDDLAKKIS